MALNLKKEEDKSRDVIPIPEEDLERAQNSKRSSVSSVPEVLKSAEEKLVPQKAER